MTSEAIIRAAEASDFPRITALLQQFEHSESEAHYRWKFRQPPLGAVNVIAERDGRLVGHYGYIIREFLIDGRPARVGLGTDMLVDRGLWGRGVATQLFHYSPVVAREHGIEYVYGFPNPRSAGAASKAAAQVIAVVPLYVRVLNLAAVWRRVTRWPYPALATPLLRLPFRASRMPAPVETPLRLEAFDRFPDELDELWGAHLEDTRSRAANVGFRTAAYLNWRFVDCPDRVYQRIGARSADGTFRGYLVLREMTLLGLRCGAIVDIWPAADRESALALCLHATRHFEARRVDLVAMMLSRGPAAGTASAKPSTPDGTGRSSSAGWGGTADVAAILRRLGFREFVQRFNPRPFPILMRETNLRELPASLRDLDRSFWTWADGDVI